MGFTAITNAEIQVGKPITQELMQKIKDNFDYLSGLNDPGISGVFNGSFEQDTDADGIPDGWTRNLYSGGAGVQISTSSTTGGKCFQFTHPGGSGNGGGYLDSEYIEINENVSPAIMASVYNNAALVLKVIARYFDKDKSYISDETIYSNSSSIGAWAEVNSWGIPPANAKFMKIRLVGGEDTASTAGVARFDNIRVDIAPKILSEIQTMASASTNNTGAFATLRTVTCKVPKGFTVLHANAKLLVESGDSSHYGVLRYKIGSSYSTTLEQYAQNYISGNLELSIVNISNYSSLVLEALVSNGLATATGGNLGGLIQYVR